MIGSLCVAICEDLLPILSMEDVDICSAFCVICTGSLCIEAMEDSLRNEIRDDPLRIEETDVSVSTDICEFLLIEPFQYVD